MYPEDIERVREKSIDDKRKLRKAYKKGEAKGLKEGFVKGATFTFAVIASITIGISGVNAVTNRPPANVGYAVASKAYHQNAHPCANPADYWVDFFEVAKKFDPETMDLDSYIYAVYCGLSNVDPKTRLADMNEFVDKLYDLNKTEYKSFVLYCQDRGLCDEVDGSFEVNEEKYRKALKDYMKEFRKQLQSENKIQEFKEGRSK